VISWHPFSLPTVSEIYRVADANGKAVDRGGQSRDNQILPWNRNPLSSTGVRSEAT
jgi:hypothetical protein